MEEPTNDKRLIDLKESELVQILETVFDRKVQQPLPPTERDLITVAEASKLTFLAVPTLYTLKCQGKIPFIKSPGRKALLFSRQALLNWLEHREPTGTV